MSGTRGKPEKSESESLFVRQSEAPTQAEGVVEADGSVEPQSPTQLQADQEQPDDTDGKGVLLRFQSI